MFKWCRKYAKLLSTYIEGLTNYIYEDGYIHPQFNQTQTQTGRLSSSEPNMQNISVRDEESKYIRKAFPSRFENGYILSLDYSQVELRVLASLSEDETMIKIFEDGDDVHTLTASSVFSLPKEMINDDLRRKAKAINFGIVYGISDWGLAEQVKITPREAKTFIERYDTTFNIYWQMLEDVAEYRVEVYKHISGIWYKLTEINADRQNGYVAITDLVGDGYVFRVVAEDRSGNILSRSAGMIIGYDIAG